DLGDGADGAARVAVDRLLVDRDGRRQPLLQIDLGLLEAPDELPRIGGERLEEPALSLPEERVERERRLSRPGDPADADEGMPGQGEGAPLEVVFPGASDDDVLLQAANPAAPDRSTLALSAWPVAR